MKIIAIPVVEAPAEELFKVVDCEAALSDSAATTCENTLTSRSSGKRLERAAFRFHK